MPAVVYTIVLSSFVMPFMFSGVVVTLPEMAVDLEASGVALGLVETVFLGTAAALLLPFGRFADASDRATVFKIGWIGFALSTLAIGFLPDVGSIIGMRAIQGAVSALISATGFALLTDILPPQRRGRAFGLSIGAVYLGLAAGPYLAGVITSQLGWRWVFFIAAAPAFVSAALIQVSLASRWQAPAKAMDWLGSTVIAAAMAPKYAPIPHFVGAAAGGTPADMEWMGKALGNRPNPGFGILAGTMIGLEREYPDRMNIYDRMRPEWKKRMRNGLKDSCVSTMVASFSGQSMRTVFNNVDVYKQHREFKVVRENSPLYYPLNPKMPLYFYHGNQDIAVPVAKLKQLAHRYCKAGTHVTLATMDLSEHLLVGFVGLPGALAWAQSRFAGLPAPNDFCEGREQAMVGHE